MAYTSITLPGLVAGVQTAWQLAPNQIVVVDIRTLDNAESMTNATTEAHLSIQVATWQANADGSPVLDASNKKLGPPKMHVSILTSALAAGTVTLAGQLTTITTEALDRAAQWLAVYPSIQAMMAASKNAPAV